VGIAAEAPVASLAVAAAPVVRVQGYSRCPYFSAGAGQDVGRSCVVVRMGGKTLMFDCGMHMGYADARRYVLSEKCQKQRASRHR
jgi:predicted metal-dependent RNase